MRISPSAWLGTLALLATLVGATVFIRGCLQIDRCLDAGGRWNDAAGACEPVPR